MVNGSKHLNLGTLAECNVVLVCRKDTVGVFLSGLLDHLEEAAFFLLAINYECATENLMTAMLTINLCKAEYLRVCQWTAQLAFNLMQVFNFLCTERQTFLFVVCFQVCNFHYGLWLNVYKKKVLVQAIFVHTLEHGVELSLLALYREVFLYA